MKNPSLLALAGLAFSFAVPAFAQQQDTVDPKIAEQVRALATKYDEAFNQNDAAAIAALIPRTQFGLRHTRLVRSGVHYGELQLDPAWDPLREDRRFAKLLAKLGPKKSKKAVDASI
jgi:hypothetical protein